MYKEIVTSKQSKEFREKYKCLQPSLPVKPNSLSFRIGSFSFHKANPKHSRHCRSVIPSKPSSPHR